MRKILFKGKRRDTKEWVYGSYLHLNLNRDYICDGAVWIGTLQPCKCEVDPSTVCQFTGLTDKNGKEIFEGDIISVEFEEDRNPECGLPPKWYEDYVVAFDDVHHCWGTKLPDGEDGEWLYEYDGGYATVIGSIHDGPVESEGSD